MRVLWHQNPTSFNTQSLVKFLYLILFIVVIGAKVRHGCLLPRPKTDHLLHGDDGGDVDYARYKLPVTFPVPFATFMVLRSKGRGGRNRRRHRSGSLRRRSSGDDDSILGSQNLQRGRTVKQRTVWFHKRLILFSLMGASCNTAKRGWLCSIYKGIQKEASSKNIFRRITGCARVQLPSVPSRRRRRRRWGQPRCLHGQSVEHRLHEFRWGKRRSGMWGREVSEWNYKGLYAIFKLL